MNSSGEAAESIVRMYLQGLEVLLKVSGSGAKNTIALSYALLKDKKQTKGKTNLANMLKSGKPSQILTVRESDLKKFSEEAKKYGVLYCVLKKKMEKNSDGIVDLLVRSEDASKVNRILDRFKLTIINEGQIESVIGKKNIDKVLKEAKDKGQEVLTINDDNIKELLESSNKDSKDKVVKELINDDLKENKPINPTLEKTEISPPSVLLSKNKTKPEVEGISDKPSVKEEMKRIEDNLNHQRLRESKNRRKQKNKNKNIGKEK